MQEANGQVEITNVMGIHLRPASALVVIGNKYPDCEVELVKDGVGVNGKSIMGVIMLAAEQGSQIEINVTGNGCEDLLAEMIKLVEDKFGED